MQTYNPTTNGPSTTSSSSGSTTEQAKEKAKEQASQAAGQARGALRGQVDQRSTEAGDRVTGVASDVRAVGEQLREQGKDQPAKLAEQAADRTERLGAYLRDSDADRILSDVEDFGRRRPWAVVAGGIAVGFAASRFLKASSTSRYEQRYESRYASSGYLPVRTGDVSPSNLGATGTGVGSAGVGGGLGSTGVRSDLGSTRTGATGNLGATSDVGHAAPPIRREPGLDDPAPGRAAEDVSLTGGVLPSNPPGAVPPRSELEGSR